MVDTNFAKSLTLTLREEGGNVDDPHDHGGRTSRGVTQRVYDAYRKGKGFGTGDVYLATGAEVADIYRNQYWAPWCSKLPVGVDFIFFDIAVNSGSKQAAKLLQRALGIEIDGAMGLHTLAAVDEAEPAKLVRDFCNARRTFFRALKQFPRYGKGWLRRTSTTEAAALAMVRAATPVTSEPIAPVAPEPEDCVEQIGENPAALAKPTDVVEAPLSPEAGIATATASGSLSAGVEQAQTMLTPFADTLKIVQYVLIAVTVLSLGLTVYAFWHARRVKAAVG